MIDIDSLLQGSSTDTTPDVYLFDTAHLINGKFKEYLANKMISSEVCDRAIPIIYEQNILDVELFDLLFRQPNLSVEHPVSKVLTALNNYYKSNDLNPKQFNSDMSELDPSKAISKYLTQLIWDDKTLAIELTGSANIDPHNDPEFVVLSVSMWWPALVPELIGFSTVYSNTDLATVFVNDIANHRIEQNDNLLDGLFI